MIYLGYFGRRVQSQDELDYKEHQKFQDNETDIQYEPGPNRKSSSWTAVLII